MIATTQGKADATATLLIAADPNVPLKPKPEYREEFEIDKERYDQLPPVFTLTELPQPAVVAADCIKYYDQYLASFPKDEQAEYDLNMKGRWEDRGAVQRFMNRALELAFGGDHFQAVEGAQHFVVDRLYLEIPTHSFCIGDSDGNVLDFYSAPSEFDQPFSIQARVNVTCPAAVAGF
jgi:hypothetical protein